MEDLFDKILDKDEKVIKVFKPNKRKLYWSAFLIYFVAIIWLAIPGIIAAYTESSSMVGFLLMAIGIVAVIAVAYLLIWILVKIYYNKLFYAYTNKRLIIRTGIFGVDYKSLDMSMIGAVNVYVSLLDKLVKKDTGSITFGSMASPMMSYNGNGSGSVGYRFANIEMPYDIYRELKTVIDEYKNSKK